MKKVITIFTSMFIIAVGLVGVRAFAAESGVFAYSGKQVTYSIKKGPNSGASYNWGETTTKWGGMSGKVVTSYVEAQNRDGQLIGKSAFDYGTTSATARTNASNVYCFNGSHSVADKSNVHKAIVTSWTQVKQ